jgi:acetyl-CoA carboxylase alpha subunit
VERIPSKTVLSKDAGREEGRIRLYGKIEAKEGDFLRIDDGAGSVGVFLNNPVLRELLDKYSPGDPVVVIGWSKNGRTEAEIIRRVEGFDPERYRQVIEVLKDVRSEDIQTGTDD